MANLSFKITADSQDFSKEMDKVKSEAGNVKQQMRNLTKETNNLEVAYRKLSDSEKNSPFGKHLRAEIDKNISELANFKDAVGDVQQNISRMASDTVYWDGMKEAITVTKDSVSAFAASLGVSTKEGTLAADAVNMLTKAQTFANAAITVGNALQKQSAIMSAIATIQMKAQAAATTKAGVAQKALNLVVKANPYVLLATAVVAAGAAIYAYTKYADGATEAERKAHQAKKEFIEAYKSQTGQLADTMVKIEQLKDEWSNLRTEGEKKQWIEDNQDAFRSLGVEIENVEDAENLLVNNTSAFLKAQELKAKALAYTAIAATKYQKAIEAKEEVDETELEWYEGAFIQLKQFAQGKYVQSFDQIQHSKAKGIYDSAVEAEEEAAEALKKANELNREAANLTSSAGIKQANKNRNKTPKSGGKSSGTQQESWSMIDMPEFEPIKVSIDYTESEIDAKIKKLQDKLKDTPLTINGEPNIEIKNIQEQIDRLKDLKVPKGAFDQVNADFAASMEKTQAELSAIEEREAKRQEEIKERQIKDLNDKSEAFQQYGNMLGSVSEMLGALGDSEEAEAAQFAVNTAEVLANAISTITAMNAEALAKGASSAFALPFPANLAAWATVLATITSIFSSLPKFAEGGIVGGNSFYGDKLFARINSGEAVLNRKQQKKAWELMESGMSGNAVSVQGVIRGRDLVLVAHNESKYQSRGGRNISF